MIDIKTEQNLAGDEHWPTIPVVTVPGDDAASAMAAGITQLEGEKVVQTWQRVAVLEVTPASEVYWGFMSGAHVQFMNVPVRLLEGRFGVRVGNGEARFFIIPKDMVSRLHLRLVTVTTLDDPIYQELPLY